LYIMKCISLNEVVSVSIRNPMTTFPMQIRINTKLFVDGMEVLYIGRDRINHVTNGNDPRKWRPLVGGFRGTRLLFAENYCET